MEIEKALQHLKHREFDRAIEALEAFFLLLSPAPSPAPSPSRSPSPAPSPSPSPDLFASLRFAPRPFSCLTVDLSIEALKAFEKREQHLKAMAATNLSFIYLLEARIIYRGMPWHTEGVAPSPARKERSGGGGPLPPLLEPRNITRGMTTWHPHGLGRPLHHHSDGTLNCHLDLLLLLD